MTGREMWLSGGAVAELAARKVELANERYSHIYPEQARHIAHEIRCLNDADAAQAVHRVLVAAVRWRSHWGAVDTTDPGEWDPAARRECEDIEELKAAVDAFDILAGGDEGAP